MNRWKDSNSKARLYDAVETVSTITCSKCNKSESFFNCDGWDAAEAASGDGWYATENNVYCKSCNEKRLKKSKPKRELMATKG